MNRRPGHEDEPTRILQKVPVAGNILLSSDTPSLAENSEGRTALNVTVQLAPWQKDIRHSS